MEVYLGKMSEVCSHDCVDIYREREREKEIDINIYISVISHDCVDI